MNTAWSVVIPTFNGCHLLAQHLPAVAKILHSGDEVIVVDDASTDNTAAWVAAQQASWTKMGINLRYCRHETNQRFAQAVNTGLAAVNNEYAFILNNDVSPLTPQLKNIVQERFAADPLLFAVGCAEVHADRADAQLFGRGTGGWRRGLLTHWYDPDQKHHPTLWTAGGSMVVHVPKYRELGGLDTLFYPAYEEDRDICYRALKHGWHLWFAYEARVLHEHETTNQTVFGQRAMTVMSWKNQFLLVWKNIHDPYLWCQHWLWLPYYLTVANWRSHGTAGQGWWAAARQAPAAWRARQRARRQARLSDRSVLASWAQPL